MSITIQANHLHLLELLLAIYLVASYFLNWIYQRFSPHVLRKHHFLTIGISINAGMALLIAYGIGFERVIDLILRWTTPHAILMLIGLMFAIVASITTLLAIVQINYRNIIPTKPWIKHTLTGITVSYIALLVLSLF